VTGSLAKWSFSDENALTVAYDAATGAERWVSRYRGLPDQQASTSLVAVSPDGSKVYTVGSIWSRGDSGDSLLLRLEAATGRRTGMARWAGPTGSDVPRAFVVSPSGDRVFIAGQSTGNDAYGDYLTLAYPG
jgi:outer membrane protein assembly factor BamB